ncbi:MAG: DUF896 domain-containing protein [Clostridiales Family XIII bacterium]|jgi:uncharacterized protein YnzC (UPF0291/DUF896 family)|nr:DUF896 domain-containing protein [Clostridiales Family XIII bacterium]
MLEKEKMERINELARKSKMCELCDAEKVEQHSLRQEYLAKFREVFRGHLENIEVVDKPVAETNHKSRRREQ